MSAVPPITRHTVGRTFFVAIAVLGLVAIAQGGVVAWFYMARFHTPPPDLTLSGPNGGAAGTRAFADPFSDPAGGGPLISATLGGARPPVTPPPKPTPISQQALAPSPLPTSDDRFNELVEQARALRERGDTYAAVTKLREAQATDPRNPTAPGELAITYEKMGFPEKAAESWSRILEMGEGAGLYFKLAEAKRVASQSQAQREATASMAPSTPSPATATVASAAGAAGVVGLGPNSKLGFGELTRKDESDPTADRKFTLVAPVRAKSRARIDVPDVIVQVMFYDVVNGKVLDRTNAQVGYKWTQPPADWSDSDVETLEVSYLLPARHVSDEERKYYGYIATVYYKNALQDFRSEPAGLAQKLPPKRVLTTDPE